MNDQKEAWGEGILSEYDDQKQFKGTWKGTFKENKPHGFCVWTYPYGHKYVGEWFEGLRNGKGTYY